MRTNGNVVSFYTRVVLQSDWGDDGYLTLLKLEFVSGIQLALVFVEDVL